MGVTRIIKKDACLLFGEPDLEVCLSSLGISQGQLRSALKQFFFLIEGKLLYNAFTLSCTVCGHRLGGGPRVYVPVSSTGVQW